MTEDNQGIIDIETPKPDVVYQNVSFEVVSINDLQLQEKISEWIGEDEDISSFIPEDVLSKLQEDDMYLIRNVSAGTIGVVDPASLTLNFEEYHPSENLEGVRKTVIEKIIEEAEKLNDAEESEDFYRGVEAITSIIMEHQGVDE